MVAATRPVGAAHPTRRSFVVVGLVLIVMIGLRREVGGDWENYLDIFNTIRRSDLLTALTRSEPAYGFLNWFAAQQGWGVWFPNLVCAIIFTWGLIALCRQQPNPLLALVVSTYIIILVAMGFTRQSAALGFVMLAIAQYSRGATVRMLIYLGLAATFHVSSVFVIPLIGVAIMRRGIGAALMIVLLGVFLAFQFLGQFESLFVRYSIREFVSAGALPRLLMNLVPAAIFLAFRRQFTASPAELRLWTIFALASFPLLVLFMLGAPTVADRLGFYLNPLQIFVLSRVPYVFGSQSRPSMFLVSVVIAMSLTIVVGWLNLGRWGHAWLPYQNYLWDFAREGEWPASARRR